MTTALPRTIAAVAIATLVCIATVGCSADGDSAASSTATPVSDETTGGTSDAIDTAVPTLPPDALDELASGAVGEPDPALPVDLTPVPFAIGQLASLGNVQLIATEATWTPGEGSTPGRMDISLRVRNASTDELPLQADSFRLYGVSGASSVPVDASGIGGTTIGADQWVTGQLTFDVPAGERAVMLVFDSAPYGDRVLSGAIVVGD